MFKVSFVWVLTCNCTCGGIHTVCVDPVAPILHGDVSLAGSKPISFIYCDSSSSQAYLA